MRPHTLTEMGATSFLQRVAEERGLDPYTDPLEAAPEGADAVRQVLNYWMGSPHILEDASTAIRSNKDYLAQIPHSPRDTDKQFFRPTHRPGSKGIATEIWLLGLLDLLNFSPAGYEQWSDGDAVVPLENALGVGNTFAGHADMPDVVIYEVIRGTADVRYIHFRDLAEGLTSADFEVAIQPLFITGHAVQEPMISFDPVTKSTGLRFDAKKTEGVGDEAQALVGKVRKIISERLRYRKGYPGETFIINNRASLHEITGSKDLRLQRVCGLRELDNEHMADRARPWIRKAMSWS